MIGKPAKVPAQKISSIDLVKFDAGLFLGGEELAPPNSLTELDNIEIDKRGFITPRRRLTKFLPDTDGDAYQKFPVLWDGQMYYFTADNGKIRFCQSTDTAWTNCSGTNSFTTNAGGMTKFLRVLDKILIINGKNGDKLAYADLASAGFPITKYVPIADPVATPSTALTAGLSTGSFNIYYAYSYSGAVGETNLSPIRTQSINHTRDEWPTLATAGVITLTRGETAPAGAQFWNVYVAIAATSGTIQVTDMLQIAGKLDVSATTFIDDGTLAINLGSVAPTANSTDGPRVEQGITVEGNPILFADQDNPYAIWIGGGGIYALDFSTSNGGYKAEPEKGTNFYPTAIVGFRTGQGTPALTVLYSNTEGLSKQAVLAQQTVNYGDSSFTVWAVTEQHYGAAGVAAPNSAINYNGSLKFLSTDGFMSMATQPSVQNVLSITNISSPIDDYVDSVKVSAMDRVVGTGWGDKYMWLVPSYGFDTPNQVLVLDSRNKGIEGNGAWYTMDIQGNWIGTISPADTEAFVYVSIGNETYRLLDTLTTADFIDGILVPFATKAVGAVVPISGEAHNSWQAAVQAVFYLLDFIGAATIGVNYRNQSGNLKTKTKNIVGPSATPSFGGGWGDPQWTYANFPQIPGWAGFPIIDAASISVEAVSKRYFLQIDDITNEIQFFVITDPGYNNYKLKSVSFEGVALGVRPDLQ